MIEIDKDNIPEQVSKRIRRYIDNPRFVPDETAKFSRYTLHMLFEPELLI